MDGDRRGRHESVGLPATDEAATKVRNLFAGIEPRARDEVFETLAEVGGVRVERIVSTGQGTPEGTWDPALRSEWVTLLRGRAALRFEDLPRPVELAPGDALLITRGRRHRVEWTAPSEPTVWLAVHFDD
ncbi:MAG: cupin domain-containing protein [Myxococcales bacterium]|nr:cupin domain-containing protein [Myxococcales bacterium]